ncbi:ATP-binding protein [Primorskyibacter sp. S87]|uniref:ATP-binding protein n=1 Tax=Primorskyibacter sp. S87 TaxID=3415126 RepID=UPI003C7BC60E
MANDLIDHMLAAMPLPAVMVDQSELIIAANADALTLLGPNLVGRNFVTILRQPQMIDTIEQGLKDRASCKTRFLSSEGGQDTTYDVHTRYVPAVGSGSGGALLVSFNDRTQLEQAGQMRRDFVANVSHELRTPLTALIGFIETLRSAARDDEAARDRFLGIMGDEASRMNRLVGDLMSLNRVESQERVRPEEQVDLTALIGSLLNTLGPLAEGAGVVLQPLVPETPIVVPGDADQLKQVFSNLIENAVKYGGSGGRVRVELSKSDRDPAMRGPAARVRVIDEGPGIDPIHLPRLTERFYRADSHRSRELGGTGLGLAIVKHIVNRHRGRLKVESELGQGAAFTVSLPM